MKSTIKNSLSANVVRVLNLRFYYHVYKSTLTGPRTVPCLPLPEVSRVRSHRLLRQELRQMCVWGARLQNRKTRRSWAQTIHRAQGRAERCLVRPQDFLRPVPVATILRTLHLSHHRAQFTMSGLISSHAYEWLEVFIFFWPLAFIFRRLSHLFCLSLV